MARGPNGHCIRTVRFRLLDRVDALSEQLTADLFDFELPPERIAQYPTADRTQSRLLLVGRDGREFPEFEFSQLDQILRPGDLLVCNDSKVIAARLEGRKESGGRVEILVERIVDAHGIWAQIKSRRPCRIGTQIIVGGQHRLTVQGRVRDLFVLTAEGQVDVGYLIDQFGRIPLPPYIKRAADNKDKARYQTVYAQSPGSVAAPTAGLHFDEQLIKKLDERGVQMAFVTLHVGAGTFAPMRNDALEHNTLHSERYNISKATSELIKETRHNGGRVIAVGTTSMRVLETATALDGVIRPCSGETNIFIKPGFVFRVVDALITNFHLPRSTLMVLVCAFGGTERMLEAYRYAIEHGFRFYSYGDAMFIEPKP